MKKSKLTRKEIEKAIEGLSGNDQILHNKIVQVESVLSLYLEYSKDTDKFNKFVKAKVEDIEKERSKTGNEKGA